MGKQLIKGYANAHQAEKSSGLPTLASPLCNKTVMRET